MPDAKRRLQNLDIREIALCRRGVHPGARFMLYKKAPDPLELEKEEDQPRAFGDHFEAARAMEIDGALDRRLYALLHTTTDIMRAEVSNREELVLDAVDAYADTMKRDVPELFAGRLAKELLARATEGPTSDGDFHAVVKSQLAEAGLLPGAPASGGEKMDFLKALTERGQAALKYVLGDRDPAEVFKGIGDEAGGVVVALFNKTAESGDKVVVLTTELEKAQKEPADPNSLESILKAVEDPGVKAYIETQAAAVTKVSGDFATFRKTARKKELVDMAKAWDCLPNAGDELVVALEKADEAGILEPIQKALDVGQAGAKLGKAMEELGIETLPGETGGKMTREEADRALVAKGAEIRKAAGEGAEAITPEKAYELACERNPDLYQATREVRH